MADKRRCKGNMYCCVPQCKSYYYENISFHTFPTDKILRTKWIHQLKIGKNVTPYMRVCSKHFLKEDYFFNRDIPCKVHRLKKNVIPSQNLPKDTRDLSQNETLIQQQNLRKENRERLKIDASQSQIEKHEPADIRKQSTFYDIEKEAVQSLLSFSQEERILNKEKQFLDKGIQVNTYEEFNQFDVSDIINTDNKIRILTGIQNLALLNVLIQALTKLHKSNTEFNCKKLILLTLMRIKLNIPFTALSALFNISHKSVQMYFQKTVKNLAYILKNSIKFPSRDLNFPNIRIVLHCTEIEIEKSKKKAKFLIGMAPSGLIIFVSKVYDGRTFGKVIFNREKLISKLCPGDTIMVDKGFLIDKECVGQNIKLIRLLRNKRQFNKSEATKNAEITRVRVHIGKIIQRMKFFRIFQNVIPLKMLANVNNIITIIVGLTNLSKPVLSVEEFS